MITGRRAPRSRASGLVERGAGGAIRARRGGPPARAPRAVAAPGRVWTSSGNDQVGDVPPLRRVLDRPAPSARRGREARWTVCAERRDAPERGRQVDLLERARAEHLRGRTWPVRARTGRDPPSRPRGPVSRFVAPGPAIERHAAGRPVSLPKAEAANAGRALVADADVGELPGLAPGARTASASPRFEWPDHAEHVGHAPGDHRLDHHVGDGAHVRRLRRHARPRRRRPAPRPGTSRRRSPRSRRARPVSGQ